MFAEQRSSRERGAWVPVAWTKELWSSPLTGFAFDVPFEASFGFSYVG
uniref:Uncharacterized protein n=1 Tax=Manihot esculenta TaxID=3983 RepID=A0A2C9WNU5_MANES